MTNGSGCGSGRLKFIRVLRIRIRKAHEHTDSMDPEPVGSSSYGSYGSGSPTRGEEMDGGCAQAYPSGVFRCDVLH